MSGDCWEWKGPCHKDGYGYKSINGKKWLLHRYAYQWANGPIPDGQCVMHICDNPPCVNPDHLALGSHDDNMKDMAKKGRARISKGENNPNRKLCWDDVNAIRRSDSVPSGELASKYGVTTALICQIRRGVIWKDD